MTDEPYLPGDAELVAVPGLGLDSRGWEPTFSALRRQRPSTKARTVVLSGYGRPARPREPVGPEPLGNRLLDHVRPGSKVVVLGHSASCQVVAHAAARSSDVVGVVLVGPTTDPRSTTWATLVNRWLATARHEPARQVPTLIRQYRRTGLRSMHSAMDAAREDRIEATLRRVDCPVLLLRGAMDRIAPADWLARLTSAAPAGAMRRRVDLPAGGHMVPLTHGGLVADAVLEFVADTVTR